MRQQVFSRWWGQCPFSERRRGGTTQTQTRGHGSPEALQRSTQRPTQSTESIQRRASPDCCHEIQMPVLIQGTAVQEKPKTKRENAGLRCPGASTAHPPVNLLSCNIQPPPVDHRPPVINLQKPSIDRHPAAPNPRRRPFRPRRPVDSGAPPPPLPTTRVPQPQSGLCSATDPLVPLRSGAPPPTPARDTLEGKVPRRQSQKRLGRRLEEVAKAVGGGYCRLQMPLRPALGVRGTVAGHRLGALEGGRLAQGLGGWLC